MITKTAKRILLALCAALAAVCVLFAISFKPTSAKASTADSGLTEVTFDKVLPTNGVTDEGVTVDYLEFDGFGNNTWFMVEFTGRNAPSFAVNATQAYDTWNAQTTAEAGYLISNTREEAWGNLNIFGGLNTKVGTTGCTQWRNYTTSYSNANATMTGTKLGLGNLSNTETYVMIVGYDQTASNRFTFSYYLYSVGEDGTLTQDTVLVETQIGLSNAGGSKAVIYPNLYHEVVRTSITFKYATPQTSLSALVNSLPETCAYKQALYDDLNGSFAFEATMNKVYATKGVAENVEYLEFDGFSGDTWFGLEFTGQSIPNFAVNAKQAFSTWAADSYTEAGIFISHSNENNWGSFRVTSSFNTTTGHFNSQSGSATEPLAIGNLKANVKYLMFLGYDKDDNTLSGDSTTNGHNSIYYYLFSVETDGTLTKIVGKSLYHGALSDSLGSKAIIYPHLRCNDNTGYDSYSPTITFNYITPQQSLSELVNSINEHHVYRAQLETLLAEEAVYNYSTQTLNISSNADHTVTNKTAEAISFNGFDGDTYMLVDFVGQNAPNFAFNATTVYSDFSLEGAKTADAGNMIWNAWGNLKFTNGHGGGGAEYFNQSTNTADGVQGFGQARFVAGTKYVVIGAYDKEDSGITMTYYIFTVATDGTVTEARPSVSTTHTRMKEATGDKAVIYPYIGAGLSSTKTTFNLVNPADTMQGLLANIPDTCTYKQSLSDYFTSSYTVTVQDEKGEEITTASVKDGDTYTLPTSDIANFVAWEIDGKLYQENTAITVTGDVTVKAVCFDFALEDGASIRISSTTEYHGGLRFTVKANTAQLNALGATVYGFVLPTDSISGELDKTDATNATELENSVTDGDYTVYYITLTNVLYSNYNRAFSAMAYVELTLADETKMTVQTAYDAEKNSRCLYDIAVAAYNDTAEYAKYTNDQKKVLTDYINSTVNLIKVDDDTYQVATVEDGLTVEYVRGYTVATDYDDVNERLVFTITITIDSKLISTSDNLPHVPVTVWTSNGNGGYVAERMSVTVQSYTDGVAILFFR